MHATLHDAGITNLVAASRRGDFTIPTELAEAYQDLEDFVANNRRPSDTEMNARVGDIFRLFNRCGGAVAVIRDHLQPAFETFMDGFREDVATLGRYVLDVNIPIGLLSETDEIRQAYIRFASSLPPYGSLRAAWLDMRKRDGYCTDPLGAASPLAEVANLPDLCHNWEACNNGRAQWPWAYNVHHIKMAWLVNNGGRLWLPTAEEQSANWAKYGAAAAA